MKQKYDVKGMTCASCQTHVNNAVKGTKGVNGVEVNLLTNSMIVDYDSNLVKPENIIKSVQNAGYDAEIHQNVTIKAQQLKKEKDLKKRKQGLLISLICLFFLLVISMGPMLLMHLGVNLGINPYIQIGLEIVFLVPIIIINFFYFTRGFKALFKLKPNMDSLIALGSTVSIIYALYSYIMMIIVGLIQKADISIYTEQIYFESAGTILTLVSLGKYFENRATNKTTEVISKLMNLAPDLVTILENNKEKTIAIEDLKVGDIVIIKPGDSIPADGTIVSGYINVDEAAITGESMPIYKKIGDTAISGTINRLGSCTIRIDKIGDDTTLNKLISLVEEASNSKAPLAKLADKISGLFVPIVISLSIITFIVWLFISSFNFSESINFAISVLVISCPCALGLATPVAIMVGTGKGAENGILIKSAEAFENLAKVDVVLFDKTGTLTEGEMGFRSLKVYEGNENEILAKVASIESLSEHPLSKAIVEEAQKRGLHFAETKDFVYEPGLGVRGEDFAIGNAAMMKELGVSLSGTEEDFSLLSSRGETGLYVAQNGYLLALFGVGDEARPSSAQAVKALKALGKRVALVSGDNPLTAKGVGKSLGIDEVFAGVLPSGKAEIVSSLQKQGLKVAFVGDGVNDAPSLSQADVGIAIGAGSDIAIDSADIILVRNDPLDVVSAISLSRAVTKNIKENLLWAFGYNVILIPLAAGVLYNVIVSWGHFVLTPTIAAIAMSLSSVTVVLNALRLRRFKKETPKEETKA